ncbi:MAG: MogA/MoaB family molybdenum cofactor biosynthesis protein [Candidatus Hodarchaeales archaeon]|jgi:molybdenum cofactor biosynthesis protein B
MNSDNNIKNNPKHTHLPKEKLVLNAGILIVSDSLSKKESSWKNDDKSGKIAIELMTKENYQVKEYNVLSDDINQIRSSVQKIFDQKIDIIITIGGTGIAKRDVTIEALKPIIDKELPGFGELFRLETYKELGSTAIMSRAFMGVINKSIIICLPGSPNAVKLGLELIIPEIQHIKNLLNR